MATSPCARCILRAQNVRQPASYAKPTAVNAPVCPVCLGILQESTISSITASLASHLKPITHNNLFKINASLPPTISVIRDRAFAIALGHRTHYPSLHLSSSPTPPTPVSLRESLKWTLSERMASMFALRYDPDAELFLDLAFHHQPSPADTAFAESRPPPTKNRRRWDRNPAQDTTMHIVRVSDSLSDEAFATSVPHLIPPPTAAAVTLSTSVSVAPAFFAGTYNKFARTISQTPWHVDLPPRDPKIEHDNIRRKRVALSVEDVVLTGLRDVLHPEKLTFSAGGREDIDVRMLGGGRPFFVEALSPRIIPSLISSGHLTRASAESSALTSSVRVNDLRQVPKTFAADLRMVEADKRKHYRCIIWTENPIKLETLQDVLHVPGGFSLAQRTPLRVLHRRTQAVRKRAIYVANVERVVMPHVFVLDVVAQAGTYIKEFVHGDNGRTTPNVASLLGCHADILQLDVTDISTVGGGLADAQQGTTDSVEDKDE